MIAKENAQVFRGGGRRWLTKNAACRAEAKAKIRERCDCETVDHGHMGREHITCSYHADMGRFYKIVRRLARMYAAHPAKQSDNQQRK